MLSTRKPTPFGGAYQTPTTPPQTSGFSYNFKSKIPLAVQFAQYAINNPFPQTNQTSLSGNPNNANNTSLANTNASTNTNTTNPLGTNVRNSLAPGNSLFPNNSIFNSNIQTTSWGQQMSGLMQNNLNFNQQQNQVSQTGNNLGPQGNWSANERNTRLGMAATPENEAAWSERMGSGPGWEQAGWAAAGGGIGLVGNLAQMGLMRMFKPDYEKFQGQQAQMQQELMDKYLPYATTNRLGQFGGQAAVEAQRRSAEGSYSIPALANLGRANASASQMEGLTSLLGSQAVQAAQRQTRNIMQQMRNMPTATPAALSAMARNAAAGGGDAVAQAMQGALSQAGQNLAQAAQTRTGAASQAEQAAQRVYETYKRPAETETNLHALAQFVQAPMQYGMQIGEQLAVIPGNPLEAMANWVTQTPQLKYMSQLMEKSRKPGVSGSPENKPSTYSGVNELVGTEVGDALRSAYFASRGGEPNLKNKEEQEQYEQDPNKVLYNSGMDWATYYLLNSQVPKSGSGAQGVVPQTAPTPGAVPGATGGGGISNLIQNYQNLYNTFKNQISAGQSQGQQGGGPIANPPAVLQPPQPLNLTSGYYLPGPPPLSQQGPSNYVNNFPYPSTGNPPIPPSTNIPPPPTPAPPPSIQSQIANPSYQNPMYIFPNPFGLNLAPLPNWQIPNLPSYAPPIPSGSPLYNNPLFNPLNFSNVGPPYKI